MELRSLFDPLGFVYDWITMGESWVRLEKNVRASLLATRNACLCELNVTSFFDRYVLRKDGKVLSFEHEEPEFFRDR